jgi:hypothetical protein
MIAPSDTKLVITRLMTLNKEQRESLTMELVMHPHSIQNQSSFQSLELSQDVTSRLISVVNQSVKGIIKHQIIQTSVQIWEQHGFLPSLIQELVQTINNHTDTTEGRTLTMEQVNFFQSHSHWACSGVRWVFMAVLRQSHILNIDYQFYEAGLLYMEQIMPTQPLATIADLLSQSMVTPPTSNISGPCLLSLLEWSRSISNQQQQQHHYIERYTKLPATYRPGFDRAVWYHQEFLRLELQGVTSDATHCLVANNWQPMTVDMTNRVNMKSYYKLMMTNSEQTLIVVSSNVDSTMLID